jgi:hydrogenase maturation protease
MSAPARCLVIGVGNRDRGDDAAGPIVCDVLREGAVSGVNTLVVEGSVLDLPVIWQPTDRVVIVDAAEPAGQPGRVRAVDGLVERLVSPGVVSTHAIDVGSAIELGRALGRLPAQLIVVGIEGIDFEFDAPLSPEVRSAVDAVANTISRLAGRPVDVGWFAAANRAASR